ncbi:MAG: IS21 family transposase [Bacteriovoracaceae bacterium]|nr:IS21 family transposase [Bacteriovoracaceae bacterium]
MARKRIEMSIQKDVLHHKGLGKNKSEIARVLGINRETVSRYWDGSPEEIIQEPEWVALLNWDYITDQIEHDVPRKILYEELSLENKLPDYSNFCRQVNHHLERRAPDPKITMKIFRQPGHSVEVDYSGDSLEIINPATGEITKVELFVGALTYSSYFYAEFTYSQKLEDFIESHTRMFEYFGGVPEFVVPDNCLTAVTKAEKHDVKLNESYRDVCKHYQVIVDPARVRRPQDKPVVEKSIDIIQKDFFPRVRNRTFTSLYEINQVLREYLVERMKVVMKERGKSRLELYLEEKTLLRPLPEYTYEICHFKTAKVHPNCHIQHLKNFYSVPCHLVGQEVQVKHNQKLLHIYHKTDLVWTHSVCKGQGHYITVEAHYPEKKMVDTNFHLNVCRIKSEKIGENMKILYKRLVDEPKHPLKNLAKIQGILALAESFSVEALENAVGIALEHERVTYAYIKQCTKNYRPDEEVSEAMVPRRQLEFVCLQGGRK